MATKKVVAPVEEELVIETDMIDPLTTITPEKQKVYNGPYVPVFLPALEDSGGNGLKVDQYEHVTIANENKENCWKILRGETVEVPVPVFVVLKAKYPKI